MQRDAGEDRSTGRSPAGRAGVARAEGRAVGGTYVAANPLEHLATAMGRVRGQQGINDTQTAQSDLLMRQRAGELADRTSFTRFLPVRGEGTWHGRDPLKW